jgi:hypothetical protein
MQHSRSGRNLGFGRYVNKQQQLTDLPPSDEDIAHIRLDDRQGETVTEPQQQAQQQQQRKDKKNKDGGGKSKKGKDGKGKTGKDGKGKTKGDGKGKQTVAPTSFPSTVTPSFSPSTVPTAVPSVAPSVMPTVETSAAPSVDFCEQSTCDMMDGLLTNFNSSFNIMFLAVNSLTQRVAALEAQLNATQQCVTFSQTGTPMCTYQDRP